MIALDTNVLVRLVTRDNEAQARRAKAVFDQPSIIIARTIPGKGVPAFERKFEWHGKAPTPKEGEEALKVLRALGDKMKASHA